MSAIDSVVVTALTAVSGSTANIIYGLLKTFLQEKLKKTETVAKPNELDRLSAQIKEAEQATSPDEEIGIAVNMLRSAHSSAISIRGERARQARLTFNVAISLSVLGVLFFFGGVVMLWYDPAAYIGVIGALVGAVVEVVSVLLLKLNKDTNDRLDQIAKDVQIIENSQVAIEVASKIETKKKRDETFQEIALEIARQAKGVG